MRMDVTVTLPLILEGDGNQALWINAGTAFGAAFLGAAAAEFFSAASRRRTEKSKRLQLSFSTLRKLMTIYNCTIMYKAAFARAEEKMRSAKEAKKQDARGMSYLFHLSSFFEGYLSHPAELEFSSDEIWNLSQSGDLDLFNNCEGLDQKYNGLIGSVRGYGTERAMHDEWMKQHLELVETQGLRHVSRIKEGSEREIELSATRLDFILNGVRENTGEVQAQTFEVICRLVQAPSRPLGRDFEVKFPNPSGVEVRVRARDGSPPRRKWYQVWRWSERREDSKPKA